MSSPSVLIVDESADNREVLRTALARRGIETLEAKSASEGLQLACDRQPDVIVLDLEGKEHEAAVAGRRFAEAASDSGSQLIVLGTLRSGPAIVGGHVIRKPYHFAPLVHTIERLAAKAA